MTPILGNDDVHLRRTLTGRPEAKSGRRALQAPLLRRLPCPGSRESRLGGSRRRLLLSEEEIEHSVHVHGRDVRARHDKDMLGGETLGELDLDIGVPSELRELRGWATLFGALFPPAPSVPLLSKGRIWRSW